MLQPSRLTTETKRSTFDQQRSCLRVHLTLPAEVTDPSGEHHAALVRDISTTGAFLYTNFSPQLDSEIIVDFVFPVVEKRMKITCEGRVVRVENPVPGGAAGIALQFRHHDVAMIH